MNAHIYENEITFLFKNLKRGKEGERERERERERGREVRERGEGICSEPHLFQGYSWCQKNVVFRIF